MSENTTYLEHILEAIVIIEGYAAAGRTQFFAERLRQDATIRQLEIIGEATKRLTSDFRARHPDVAWRSMAAFRDVLIHNYLGVDLEIVWTVVHRDLPLVAQHIQAIIEEDRDRQLPANR
ncbi:MAG: DUF86 domain-containing protein [Thermomicrobiales bacterium]